MLTPPPLPFWNSSILFKPGWELAVTWSWLAVLNALSTLSSILFKFKHTHVKMRALLQICKQVVTRLLSSRYQDVFALFVPSCCDKSGTSCYHLVTRLMTVTDVLQVVPTRLTQAVRNKLLRTCCHQLVNDLLRADDIRLVGTTCCESVGLIKLVTRAYNMITTCCRLVNNWKQAVRTHLEHKLWDFYASSWNTHQTFILLI
jgi:hypothetical protein